MGIFTTIAEYLSNSSLITQIGILAIVAVLTLYATNEKVANAPPLVDYKIPFLGNAVEYGIHPINFLKECMEKYGECFTFVMMGRKMTFCLGPEGNHFVFNAPIANASAEGAYDKLTVPVFGKEVVYDVPNALFMEQKKFVKDALTTNAFKGYVPQIIQETQEFFNEWKFNSGNVNVFHELSELTIRTASRCLMGKEIRKQLHSNVAKLYADLDAGFAPINVFFRWLPLPSYFNRDKANRIMTETFMNIIKERRDNNNLDNDDVLQALMDAKYKDGRDLSDIAVSHLMIALLMGGQHTSSTTGTWILFELANSPGIIDEILKEQSMVLTGKPDTPVDELPDFDYDQLKQMNYLDCVVKETLRLHPPIHTMMRKVEKDLNFKEYTIPKGHFICGAPSVSQLDSKRFPDPMKFNPGRFKNSEEGSGEWTINGVDIAQKSAKSHFLPFGAGKNFHIKKGRHRCIGEAFAFVQIKTIIACFVREFKHDLFKSAQGEGFFPKSDYTSLITMPEKPCYITVTRRNSKQF